MDKPITATEVMCRRAESDVRPVADAELAMIAPLVDYVESNLPVDKETLKDLLHYHMADARRYRWLRANAKEIVFGKPETVTCYGSTDDKPEELDAAVDRAMAEK